MKDIIEGAGCGVCVPPSSPKQLASEIVSIIDDKNKMTSYRENARVRQSPLFEEEVLIALFRSLVK